MLLSMLIKRRLKFASLAEKSRVKNIFLRGVCASSFTQNTVDRATYNEEFSCSVVSHTRRTHHRMLCTFHWVDDKRASKKKSPRLLSCCLKLNGRSIWMCNWNLKKSICIWEHFLVPPCVDHQRNHYYLKYVNFLFTNYSLDCY